MPEGKHRSGVTPQPADPPVSPRHCAADTPSLCQQGHPNLALAQFLRRFIPWCDQFLSRIKQSSINSLYPYAFVDSVLVWRCRRTSNHWLLLLFFE
jgi:hypothetical protein